MVDMPRRESRNNIVGQRIEQLLPRDDYVSITLSNGKEYDLAVDPDEITEPKHPLVVKRIYSLEGKLYDVTYRGKPDKAKQQQYKTLLKGLKDSMVGEEFTFNGKPCLVKKVISTENENSVVIDVNGMEKKINIYSLEKRC